MTEHESRQSNVQTDDRLLTVSRVFDAPVERVFRAFTDPDELEEWYAPGEMGIEVHAFSPEPDGSFSISMTGGDAPHDVEGTFVEVVENERLVHTWQGPSGPRTRVTITFDAVEDGTEVVLTHEEFESRDAVESHAEGWSSIFERLAGHL